MNNNELYHHGIIGMKWGVRRYQNKDGTLTNAGKKRYSRDDWSEDAKTANQLKSLFGSSPKRFLRISEFRLSLQHLETYRNTAAPP